MNKDQNKNLISAFLDFNETDNGPPEVFDNFRSINSKFDRNSSEKEEEFSNDHSKSKCNAFPQPFQKHTNNQFSMRFPFESETPIKIKSLEKNSLFPCNQNSKISWKRNLFGSMEENESPNTDVIMQWSPIKAPCQPMDKIIDIKYNKDSSDETFKIHSSLNQQNSNGYSDFSFIKNLKSHFADESSTGTEQRKRFLSGMTPHVDKPISNEIKLNSKENKRKRNQMDESDQDSNERRKNPFLEITPQMKRAIRKWSFEKDTHMLDFSSPTRNMQFVGDGPTHSKTISKMQKLTEDYSTDEKEEVHHLFEQTNDRGEKFYEDFDEICTIGKGRFGSVIKCQNKLDNIEYAVKITEKQHPKKRQFIEEAWQEVYALAAINASTENSYIVRYYRGWVENAQLYIQMELWDCSLYDQFVNNRFNEKEILSVLRDIALGLKELHEKDIVHLDLKLENILVGSTGKYKIGDLGLSRLIKKLKNNLPEGDIRYLALEKLNADHDPTPIDHK